jgi:hypothetical protein
MSVGLKVELLSTQLTVVADNTKRVTFDLLNLELVVIEPTAAGGTAFGAITTDTLVPASWVGGARRFGAVPSTEVVVVGAGARRWGAVPSDESVPADSDWTA